MKTKTITHGLYAMAASLLASCSEIEIPEHNLDVEFSYELVCSNVLLKYVTPEVTFTDAKGVQRTVTIESSMWEGNEHKTWKQTIHYDSLNVSNTATVRYVPKAGITYQDESGFESVYNLSCLISIKEDGDGRRNDFTIVPDFPSVTDVSAQSLESFINRLSSTSTTRGGIVSEKGDITKIENTK